VRHCGPFCSVWKALLRAWCFIIVPSFGAYLWGTARTVRHRPNIDVSHPQQRVSELIAFNMGGAIGYFTGDPLRILEDAQILKPTAFPSVPRLLNRIYQAANAAGDVPGLKGGRGP
jgi:hypothetical protein